MRFMVIETFTQGPQPVYRSLAERGRSLPDGVVYLDSWVDTRGERCFQLMEADSLDRLTDWTQQWQDLVDFEIVTVIPSAEAARRFGPSADP